MKKVVFATVTALLALALGGCGGGGEAKASKSKSEAATASLAATPTPTPVETQSCRTTLAPLLDVFDVMRTEASGQGMDQSALQVRFEKLRGSEDSVRAACTDAVYAPYSMAVYELALVNAKNLTCDSAAACRKAGVQEHMQKALDQQANIEAALEVAK